MLQGLSLLSLFRLATPATPSARKPCSKPHIKPAHWRACLRRFASSVRVELEHAGSGAHFALRRDVCLLSTVVGLERACHERHSSMASKNEGHTIHLLAHRRCRCVSFFRTRRLQTRTSSRRRFVAFSWAPNGRDTAGFLKKFSPRPRPSSFLDSEPSRPCLHPVARSAMSLKGVRPAQHGGSSKPLQCRGPPGKCEFSAGSGLGFRVQPSGV